jgi:aspartate kinase
LFYKLSDVSLIVQKYGGTSVSTAELLNRVADRVARLWGDGHSLVVVVSARAGETSTLIAEARTLSSRADGRLVDLLLATGEQVSAVLFALALNERGVPTAARVAAETHIYTDNVHNDACIRHVDTRPYWNDLRARRVVVVSGFQGISEHGDLTTLGRGGSDLTAVALAHFLRADRCQLLKTTGGVHRVDPALVPNGDTVDYLSYDQSEVFAGLGAKVIQEKAARFARRHRVPFEIAHSLTDSSLLTQVGGENPTHPPIWGLAVSSGNTNARYFDDKITDNDPRYLSMLLSDNFTPFEIPFDNGHLREQNGTHFLSFAVEARRAPSTARAMYAWMQTINGRV